MSTVSSNLQQTGQQVVENTFIQMRRKPAPTTFSSKALSFNTSTDQGFGLANASMMIGEERAPYATYDQGLTTNRETGRE